MVYCFIFTAFSLWHYLTFGCCCCRCYNKLLCCCAIAELVFLIAIAIVIVAICIFRIAALAASNLVLLARSSQLSPPQIHSQRNSFKTAMT